MILVKNGLFYLKNDSFSYLFQADGLGLLRHIHFGVPVQPEDAGALSCQPGLGWGSSLLLDEEDSASGPDFLPLEWSGSGRGDYRESPLELEGQSTDLRYAGYRIHPGTVETRSGLPQARDARETLEVILEQPGLRLRLYYAMFDSALTRRAVLENTGAEPVALHKLMSFATDLPGEFRMRVFGGGWASEMRPSTAPVGLHRVVNESLTGSSSNRHNPGFLLFEDGATETAGRVFGFNLIYSGNHYASCQRSHQGLTRVMQGISPSNFRQVLAPGARFETPEAVLCASDRGFSELSRRMHDFVHGHIIPPYWRDRARPVLYNSWEGCMFDFNEHRLLDLADRAAALGCELFVLDDGWFGNRDNDRRGLGDYTVNRKKLPHGLPSLARRITAKGMEFGLWFEPESVNPDSDLYRAHPDWALRDEFPDLLGRHQLLLDLSRQEVRDYIVENVSRILDSAPISYVKWDMNRHSVALGARAHACVLGLYDVLRRIFGPRPQILLESCSSGGNRFDLGMLCFSPQIWASDNTDPVERLTIQESLNYLYPQSTFGAHVSASPHAQTLRATPLSTRGNVAFFGCLGYELDLKQLLPVEVQDIKAQIAFYRTYRHALQFGQFARIPGGWQVTCGGIAIVGYFHRLVPAAPGYEQLRCVNLEADRLYRVTDLGQSIRVGQFSNLLKHVLPVSLNPNGAVIRAVDRHYRLPDGACSRTVSGAALMSGILRLPMFRGTGYDKNQYTQGDFGSTVYVLEALGPQDDSESV